ncbi:SDR family NAD(P)-dependent oxidoreductase [Gynuella sp.]|uniref:SDR family NAD(P)-dependent oxidoreductase n=1 Tax=Gynuella sp. TaxID=2969146 RepID=UPI003D11FA92
MNNYMHGLVAIPVVHAMAEKSVFAIIQREQPCRLSSLVDRTGANAGHLLTALLLLEGLGYIEGVRQDSICYVRDGAPPHLPANIHQLLVFPFDEYLRQSQKKLTLKPWIDLMKQRWQLDPELAMYLDGCLLVPLLLSLNEHGMLELGSGQKIFTFFHAKLSVHDELVNIFHDRGWLEPDDGDWQVTGIGEFVARRIFITASVASYLPMYSQIDAVIFGDCQEVFSRDSEGHEKHVDRSLNVLGSGFQHQKFFSELESIVSTLFNHQPVSEQPRYIADMGCGDGQMLFKLYQVVRDKTERGKQLEQYPLKLIGIDYNKKSLIETSATLNGLDHLVIHGDIGDPQQMINDLIEQGIEDTENILHVRSFLDHDRPYLKPVNVPGAYAHHVYGSFTHPDGTRLMPEAAYQSLVEHMSRWAEIRSRFGFLILEVHCLGTQAINQHRSQTESLNFDAYHRFSSQLLLEAADFIAATAESGLIPEFVLAKTYPRIYPFTRITLNYFRQCRWCLRIADVDDIPVLERMEKQRCEQDGMVSDFSDQVTIAQRIQQYPTGQWVATQEGKVVAVIYSQRIANDPAPRESRSPGLQWLHQDNGPVAELLYMCAYDSEVSELLYQFARYYHQITTNIEAVVGDERLVTESIINHRETEVIFPVKLSETLTRFVRRYPLDESEDDIHVEAVLDEFCVTWLIHNFSRMGIFLDQQIIYPNTLQLADTMGVEPKYRQLLDCLVDILIAHQVVDQTPQGLRANSNYFRLMPKELGVAREQFKRRFIQQYPSYTANIELVFETLDNMPAVLRGDVSIYDVVFANGDMSLFSELFIHNPVSRYFNELVAESVLAVVEQKLAAYSSDKLKILEVGAGTGGVSEAVLCRLKAYGGNVEYDYTDISGSFTRYGQKRFSDQYPFVQFKRLDIEEDPIVQGFIEQQYEVVVAANVLHDTRLVVPSLERIRKLLKPGGVFVLNEFTAMKDFLLYTGCFLHGPWLFEDPQDRLNKVCMLSSSLWEQACEKAGFEHISAYGLPFIRDAEKFRQSVLVAHAGNHMSATETANTVAKVNFSVGSNNSEVPVQQLVETVVHEILGESRAQALTDTHPFMEAGIDSIEMLELRTLLARRTGHDLTAPFLFQYNTKARVVEYFTRHGVMETPMLPETKALREQPEKERSTDVPPVPPVKTPQIPNEHMKSVINDVFIEIIGEVRDQQLAEDRPFMEAGIDSIEMLEIRTLLSRKTNQLLDAPFLFEHNTKARLYQYFSTESKTSSTIVSCQETTGEVTDDGLMLTVPCSKEESHVSAGKEGLEQAPIAVIGMALRFPGDCTDENSFWQMLANGESAVGYLPADRWQWPLSADLEEVDRGLGAGAFLERIDEFDPAFFRLGGAEAELMDPQQRLLLELSWELLENAGYKASKLAGSQTAVYVGACHFDYRELVEKASTLPEAHLSTGNHGSILANRISYFYDFHGPSVLFDTACSSSLVAIHYAVNALRHGECTLALAGGVNLMCSPMNTLAFYRAGMLSREGRCKVFDASADGYVRGEGAAFVLLKPLHEARQDGDTIHGLIRGSAVNHGGQASSLTAPSPAAQSELLKQAYRNAGVSPLTVGYIEAHGTGTSLGDPIEIQGLQTAFQQLLAEESQSLPEQPWCGIGSIKTNIGHLEGASGIAGFIKALLCVKNGALPASLNYQRLNPNIRLSGDTPFYVVQHSQSWPLPPSNQAAQPRRAGVSAFGFGGANAHVVLEQFADSSTEDGIAPVPAQIIVLSARNEQRLIAAVENLRAFLQSSVESLPVRELARVAYTLQTRREEMDVRMAVVVRSIADLCDQLDRYVAATGHGNRTLKGNVRQDKEQLSLFWSQDKQEAQAFVRECLHHERLEKLAQCWCWGADVDWQLLWTGRQVRPVTLPGYPFARERYWIESSGPDFMVSTSRLHPLVDKNISTLASYSFHSVFTGNEFYLRDHQVSGQTVLPGAAYIEMARFCVETAAEQSITRIQNLSFQRLFSVNHHHAEIFVSLSVSGSQIDFEFHSGSCGNERQVFCDGQAFFSELPWLDDKVGLNELISYVSDQLTVAQCYELLESCQLRYGGTFQVIQKFYYNAHESVTRLVLPSTPNIDNQALKLHPAILDGAFQSVVVLLAARGQGRRGSYLPLSIEAIEIIRAIPDNCYVYARPSDQPHVQTEKIRKYDISILDDQGHVCIRIHNLVLRINIDGVDADPERSFYQFPWVEKPLAVAQSNHRSGPTCYFVFGNDTQTKDVLSNQLLRSKAMDTRIILVQSGREFKYLDNDICQIDPGSEEDYVKLTQMIGEHHGLTINVLHLWSMESQINERHEPINAYLNNGFYSLLFFTKQLIKQRLNAEVYLLYFYAEANEWLSGLSGFHNTIAREHPSFHYKNVHYMTRNTASVENVAEQLVTCAMAELHPNSYDSVSVQYDGRERKIRQPQRLNLRHLEIAELTVKHSGVYLVTGGSGALGVSVAKLLCTRSEPNIVLVGRRPPEVVKAEWSASFQSQGDSVRYIQSDISYPEQVRSLIAQLKAEYGSINGIVHCAGVIRDAYVFNKTLEQAESVIAPKALGVTYLDQYTQDEKLEFFLLFSSISAVFGNPGQADYAFANAFMDAFAEHREVLRASGHRNGVCRSINWPLWQEGGMRPDEQSQAFMEQQLGLCPIPQDHGLAAVVQALYIDAPHLMYVEGNPAKIETALKIPTVSEKPISRQSLSERTGFSQADFDRQAVRFLKDMIVTEMKLSADGFDEHLPFEQFGINSLMIVKLNKALEAVFGELSKTLFFEYQTLTELAGYFIANHRDRLRELVSGKTSDHTRNIALSAVASPQSNHLNHLTSVASVSRSLQRDADDMVAIIGLSGRYPGADTLDQFWENLKYGRDSIEEIPRSRWDHDRFFDPDPDRKGRSYSKWGGFISHVDRFDPLFFNISPKEAELIDPQERLFLQTSWETLEDAGYTRRGVADKRVGVFVGVMYGEYQFFGAEAVMQGGPVVTASMYASIANRVSYFFNFHGPSIALDTMCSSSLTAIHLACDSIRNGDSEIAIAGGVNVSIHPYKYVFLSQGKFAAKDGRCRSFGADGSGYVPGEGVGAVLLKPYRQALADGDHVYGIILGSAVNHGGKTNGYAVPNPVAQADVIDRAMSRAGIRPQDVNYIETHGTGTALGDPIEITGLSRVYDKHAPARQSCAIGSVKSNIGHLESAAGIAALTKVLLQLKHHQLVPSLHSGTLNPNINFANTAFYVQQNLTVWRPPLSGEKRRIAAISSFGAGGVNAHMIIAEHRQAAMLPQSPEPQLIVLSAATQERLRIVCERLMEFVEPLADPQNVPMAAEEDLPNTISLADIAYTLQVGREAMKERVAFVASDISRLIYLISHYLDNNLDAADIYCGSNMSGSGDNAVNPGHGQISDLPSLARRWVSGANIDWKTQALNQTGRKVSLPTYPFAQERCWAPGSGDGWLAEHSLERGERLHPLIDQNISTLTQQCFVRTFKGHEFYLRDHLVDGKSILPGVAYIEMVRAASALSSPDRPMVIQQMSWTHPIEVKGSGKTIYITLQPETRGVQFEVYSDTEGQKVIHSQGLLMDDPGQERAADVVDVEAFTKGCATVYGGTDIYRQYEAVGFGYGPSFRVTQSLWVADRQALALIRLPEEARNEVSEFMLHPALMDGALRTLFWANYPATLGQGLLLVPYSIGRIEILHALPETCYAYARVLEQPANSRHDLFKYQISVLNEQGQELVRIDEFVCRPFRKQSSLQQPVSEKPVLYYQPQWLKATINQSSRKDPASDAVLMIFQSDSELLEGLTGVWRRIIRVAVGEGFKVLGDDHFEVEPSSFSDYQQLFQQLNENGLMPSAILHLWNLEQSEDTSEVLQPQGLDQGLFSMVAAFQALSTARPNHRCRCVYAYLGGADSIRPEHDAVGGFIRSTIKANPYFQAMTVQLERTLLTGNCHLALLLRELNADRNIHSSEVRLNAAGRYERRLRSLHSSGMLDQAVPLKTAGVYLLTGGLGAIGEVFARYLSERYQARLVLVGRSVQTDQTTRHIRDLELLGGKALYVQADVADSQDVQRLFATVNEHFQDLNGIFHIAGVVDNTPILQVDQMIFAKAIAAKVQGTINLDYASQSERLDFFILFSSISAMLGDFGSGSYAAANRFMDSYADKREQLRQQGQRYGRTLSINWPLWSSGGMDADLDEESQRLYENYFGMQTFDGVAGIRAFEWLLRQDCSQAVVVRGEQDKIESALGLSTSAVKVHSGAPADREISQPLSVGPEASHDPLFVNTERFLKNTLSVVIKLAPDRIDANARLQAYGIDSVMIMDLNRLLAKDIADLPGTLFFEYENISEITEYLLREHRPALEHLLGRPSDSAEAPAQQQPTAAVNTLSNNHSRFRNEMAVRHEHPGLDRASPEVSEIAVIGIAGRYPEAEDLEVFWKNLQAGADAIREIPADRWRHQQYFDSDPDCPGKSYSKWGGFIADVDKFDSLFFQISSLQAKTMDPQERLFLETAWSAIEDAGYTRATLPPSRYASKGLDVGVFVGVMWDDYAIVGAEESFHGNPVMALSNRSAVANQVSYFFDFRGPSMVVDTACSSSLVAIHQACESLRRGECLYALAGGVNVMVHPGKYVNLSRMKMLSSDGHCRSFGAGGDGYVPGEGVGAVLLKSLTQAVTDRDSIRAVIKASVVNHGGKTNGFTVPNPNAQEDLIRTAVHRAGIDPRSVNYVEAHGTGTSLGDPIEYAGLDKALGRLMDGNHVCALGSVKSNIGHLESAAGIAALTKVILQLQHQQIVPSLHSATHNPLIDFEHSAFYLPQALGPWHRVTVQEADHTETVFPRRAGISSFGAGGTNVHLIVEEYELPKSNGGHDSSSMQLIVLSAKNSERLQQKAGILSSYLTRQQELGNTIRLQDVACTLLTGREQMPERLAMVVQDMNELISRFAEYGQGREVDSLYRGNARHESELPALISEGESGKAFIRSLVAAGDIHKLARLWVSGVSLDPVQCAELTLADARRISLPTYPFIRERHWYSVPERRVSHSYQTLHPLLDKVDYSGSLGTGIRFRKTLSSAEPIVADHIVKGQKILPGVGYLEMAFTALAYIQPADNWQLNRITWSRPVVVDDRDHELELSLLKQNDDILFELRSVRQQIVHASGSFDRLQTVPVTHSFSIEQIKGNCSHLIDADHMYRKFAGQGLQYGPYFQGIDQIWKNDQEALGRLTLPSAYQSEQSVYLLHPALLDSALQTVSSLLENEAMEDSPLMPFSAENLIVFRPLSANVYVYVRHTGHHRFSVSLIDDQQRECARIETVYFRRHRDTFESFSYKPRWMMAAQTPASKPAAAGSILIVSATNGQALVRLLDQQHADSRLTHIELSAEIAPEQWFEDSLINIHRLDMVYFLAAGSEADLHSDDALQRSQQSGVLALFQLIKALQGRGLLEQPVSLKVLTRQVFGITEDLPLNPADASLIGLARVIDKEFPKIKVCCIDYLVDDAADYAGLVRQLVAEPVMEKITLTVLRDGVRYQRILERVQLPAANQSIFRPQGVYLILGGTGAIGLDTALYLSERYQARLVLVGRSELTEARQARVTQIEAAGGEVMYLQADASNRQAMQNVIDAVHDRFGVLNGVIHSVIDLVNEPITQLSEARFKQALQPKVDASYVLYQVCKEEPLDFMLFYSSGIAFEGNQGQAGYAAGCAFKDAFAHYLDQRMPYPVKTINWGYWNGAAIPEREAILQRFIEAGIEPISRSEGMESLERLLISDVHQVLTTKASSRILENMGIPLQYGIQCYPQVAPSLVVKTLAGSNYPLPESTVLQSHQQAFQRLERFAQSSLLKVFQQMGFLKHYPEVYAITELRERMKIDRQYDRLFLALLDILATAGFIELDGDSVSTHYDLSANQVGQELSVLEQTGKQLYQECAEVRGIMPLLSACLNDFPAILTGHKNHMEVMFPGGSKALVEGVYKGNRVTDYYNGLTADIVRSYIVQRLNEQPHSRIHILEVGAGTGATSSSVLEAIWEYSDHIQFTYTDISSGFISHGKKLFCERYPFVDFKVLDIENDIAAQGFEAGTIDLIYGSNVFHATRHIEHTLGQIKILLRKNGLALINEGTWVPNYTTLTFGLTSGWWLFEDAACRLPGAPLLSQARWKQLLQVSGYRNIEMRELTDSAGDSIGQSLFIAESDGEVLVETALADNLRPETSKVPTTASVVNQSVGTGSVSQPQQAQTTLLSEEQFNSQIQQYVAAVFARVLEMDASVFDVRATYDEYGIDSLVVLELNKAFEKDLGRLPSTLLFDNITIEQITTYFLTEKRSVMEKMFRGPQLAKEVPQTEYRPSHGERATGQLTTADVIHTDEGNEDLSTAPPGYDQIPNEMEALVANLSDDEVDELLRKLTGEVV